MIQGQQKIRFCQDHFLKIEICDCSEESNKINESDKKNLLLVCNSLQNHFGKFRVGFPNSESPIKGQLNSEWIDEVIVSPKMPTKNFKDFCPTKPSRIVALFFGEFLVSVGSFFGYDHCLVGRAEILDFFLAFWEKQWPHKVILVNLVKFGPRSSWMTPV